MSYRSNCRICKRNRSLNNRRSRLCCECEGMTAARSIRLKAERKQRAEAYDGLVELYGEQCMICGHTPNNRRLNVDHCHYSKQLRGLLCFRCNYGLHWFRDSSELLGAAAQYMRQFS